MGWQIDGKLASSQTCEYEHRTLAQMRFCASEDLLYANETVAFDGSENCGTRYARGLHALPTAAAYFGT